MVTSSDSISTTATEEQAGSTPLHQLIAAINKDDLMERGFVLAYFLYPDRSAAIDILISATNKLKARVDREQKRTYWRDKFLKHQITRITREDQDALQWLIYLEADSRELEQEARGEANGDDMIVRYIKTLIRISTVMSSFYVNVAVHRLLHCYTTSESQQIYEIVADSYRGADAYRRAKRLLMLRLEARFAGRVRTVKADHGETKYEFDNHPERFIGLALECLYIFTPWSTQGKCPLKSYSGTSSYQLNQAFRRDCENIGDQDKIEIRRCHAFIDPDCLSHLGKALRLATHSSKLGIPRFYMDTGQNTHLPSGRLPETRLTDQERQSIEAALTAAETRRKKIVARIISFVVDGIECARVDCGQPREIRFEVPHGARLLEIVTNDGNHPLVLATHFLELKESKEESYPSYVFHLRKGVHIKIAVLRHDAASDSHTLAVSITGKKLESVVTQVQQWLAQVPAVPIFTFTLLVLVAVATVIIGNQRRSAKERSHIAKGTSQQQQIVRSGRSAQELVPSVSYQLIPDDLLTRGSQGRAGHSVVLSNAPSIINLELPVVVSKTQYQAVLRQLESRETILIGSDLKPTHGAATAVVTFSIPSKLLMGSHYYRVELRDVKHPNEVRTFTFNTGPVQY